MENLQALISARNQREMRLGKITMEEKKRQSLLIALEAISLGILLPIFYWGTVKLLFVPLVDSTYYPHHKVSTLVAFLVVLGFDTLWIVLMRLCPRNTIHVKVVLTVLVLTVSAAILSCFVIADALDKAFS